MPEGILVDSSTILDIFEDDPTWSEWSVTTLDQCGDTPLLINPIIYAEVAIGFERIEELEHAIHRAGFRLVPLPREAAFLAGKALAHYGHSHPTATTSILPDLLIGAHAATTALPLITRNPQRVARHFPTVRLITPAVIEPPRPAA